jgi:co-chaperonin GroES (HSP10)
MIRTLSRLAIALLVATQTVGAQNTYSYSLCARDTVPDYGFASIDCINCEISSRGQPWIVFHNEPSIRGVRVPGPAAGKLQDGDVIIAIDGIGITTRAGAERYSSAKRGDTVVFRVRQGNDIVSASLVAGSLCGADGRQPNFKFSTGDSVFSKAYWAFRTDSLKLRYTLSITPKNAALLHKAYTFRLTPAPYFKFRAGMDSAAAGWIGIGMFRMVKTTEQLRTGEGGAVFSAFPEIAAIAPGSHAELAGVALGDTLIAVDGISVLSPVGALKFLNAPPGVALRLTLRRNGQTRDVNVVPKDPPASPPVGGARYKQR